MDENSFITLMTTGGDTRINLRSRTVLVNIEEELSEVLVCVDGVGITVLESCTKRLDALL